MRYRIHVLTLQEKVLVFDVEDYKIIDGNFIEFKDKITKQIKRFPTSRCEIQEVGE